MDSKRKNVLSRGACLWRFPRCHGCPFQWILAIGHDREAGRRGRDTHSDEAARDRGGSTEVRVRGVAVDRPGNGQAPRHGIGQSVFRTSYIARDLPAT